MRTEDLIADLAGRVTPVRPLPTPGVRAIGWLALAGACGVASVAIVGARPDVMLRLAQPDYLWTAALALVASIFAGLFALVLAVPGAERSPLLRLSTLAVLAVWMVTMVWAVVEAGLGLPFSTDPHWPVCFARGVAFSVVPVLALVVMIRRGMALSPGWTAAIAAIAAASMSALAVQIVCPLDDAGHAFLGHFIPVTAMAALGIAARASFAGKTPASR